MAGPQKVEYFAGKWKDTRRRLTAMEQTHDPATMGHLERVGVGPGWTCLEVGAGGGSIARWLGSRVGADGRVLAVDLDIGSVGETGENVEVRRSDVRTEALPQEAFDLIHARLVLGHIAEREAVLDSLVASLRPGGWLVLEEADTSYMAPALDNALHREVMVACAAALGRAGYAHTWGRHVPGLLHDRGLTDVTASCEAPLHEGGSAGMEWLYLTCNDMNSHGLLLDVDDSAFAEWASMAERPGEWFGGLPIVATSGRRPVAV